MKSCEEYVIERLEKVEAELTASNKELLKCVLTLTPIRLLCFLWSIVNI